MALTDKQRSFVIEYVKDFNATQAAIRAGYSERTARSIGCENLTKPDIKAEIDRYFDEKTMSAKEVLYHLTEIARGDMGDVVDAFGTPDFEIAADHYKTNLIKKIRTKTVYTKDESEVHTIEFELYDRLSALDKLARYHQLTTTTQIKTWRDEAVEAIKRGEIDYEVFVEMFEDESLAQQLFMQAGVPVEVE